MILNFNKKMNNDKVIITNQYDFANGKPVILAESTFYDDDCV